MATVSDTPAKTIVLGGYNVDAKTGSVAQYDPSQLAPNGGGTNVYLAIGAFTGLTGLPSSITSVADWQAFRTAMLAKTSEVSSTPLNLIGEDYAQFLGVGSSSADSIGLNGGPGPALVIGNGGNDTITGGGSGGDVTAGYSGNASDYQVVKTGADTYTVTDLRAGSPDGTDTLTHVQLLQFSDKTTTVDGGVPVITKTTVNWKSGNSGSWTDASNWIGGAVPGAQDDALVSGPNKSFVNIGNVSAGSLTADFSQAYGAISVGGTVNLSGALTLKSAVTDQNAATSGTLDISDGATLSVAGGIKLDPTIRIDGGSGTINAAIQNNGYIILDPNSHLVINGAVTGTGYIGGLDAGAALDLNGASSGLIYLNGGTLNLGKASAVTSAVSVGYGVSTLNLEGGSFGGSLDFFKGSTLDLTGIQTSSVSVSGGTVHLVETNGQTLDLNAYYFPTGSGVPGSFDPTKYALAARTAPVVASDGHGGTLLRFVEGVGTWAPGQVGDWSDATKWASGLAPSATDDVLITPTSSAVSFVNVTGTQTAASVTEDASAGLGALVAVHGTLNVTNGLTLTSQPGGFGSASIVVDHGAALNAGTIKLDTYSVLNSSGGAGDSTVKATITNNGAVIAGSDSHLTVNGAVTGSGFIRVSPGATLDLNGSSNARVELYEGGTLRLGQASSVTSAVSVAVGKASLDTEGASFAGSLSIGSGNALTAVGALTLDGTTSHVAGVTLTEGAFLNAASGLTLNGAGLVTRADWASSTPATTPAVIHGDVHNNSQVDVASGQLLIDGSLGGTGTAVVEANATLEVKGALSLGSVFLRDFNSTLILDDGANVTSRIDVFNSSTLDLKSSTAFHGQLAVHGVGTTVDLAGVTTATLNGDALHVTTSTGASFDIAAAFSPTTSQQGVDPNFSLVTADDGHGGITIRFQSTVNHAPIASPVSLSVPAGSMGPSSGMISTLSGSDPDGDGLTLVSIKPHGAPDSAAQATTAHGQYGDLNIAGYGAAIFYSPGDLSQAPVGQHPVDVFDYTVSDGRGGLATGSVTVSIDRVPTAHDDQAVVAGASLTRDAAHGVLANDTDPDGDTSVVRTVTGSDGTTQIPGGVVNGTYGYLTLNSDGSYTYTKTALGPIPSGVHDTFTYTIENVAVANASGGTYNSGDPTATLDFTFYSNTQTSAGQVPSSIASQGTPNTSVTQTGSDGSTTVARYDAGGQLASVKTTFLDGSTDTFAFSGGKLTTETQVHADQTKDIYQSNITGQAYTSAHTAYDASGHTTEYDQRNADGSLHYQSVYASDGSRVSTTYGITGQSYASTYAAYNASGQQTEYGQKAADGALHLQTLYAGDGSSDSKVFAADGVTVTTETLVHADKTKEVLQFALGNPAFAVAHTSYDAAGKVTEYDQKTADGALHYQVLYGSDGSTDTKLFATGGVLTTDTLLHADHSKEVTQFALGNPAFASAHTSYDAAGKVTEYDQKLSDGTLHYQSLYASDGARVSTTYGITGQSYTTQASGYTAGGTLAKVDLTNLDGSHSQSAYLSGQTLVSTAGVVDLFKSAGGDTLVFAAGFGKDVISGFHAGSAAGHDVLWLDASEVADFASLQSHMTASGSDTLLSLSATDTILLKGIALSSLTADDFLFRDHGLLHA
ncbi:beta strand repeat-containing protein [Methylobacterium nigriterrae]|uniref:beta strand repeat-containing protein n=1 Tax=Methylobacterium nigriterrae TaxID=3127512 RepID=UPI003013BA25